MSGVVVIGSQWGDEGKGKVVDWLSERADVVMRFQGGHNAGHTLVVNGITYKLALLPSGIVRPDKLSLIGSGVVIDPWAFRNEIEHVQKLGLEVNCNNLKIADNACLILPIHSSLDCIRENNSKGLYGSVSGIGTTCRGIGPAYEDKVGRRAIRIADLFDEKGLKDKILHLVSYHNILRTGMQVDLIDAKEVYDQIIEIIDFIKPYTCIMWKILDEIRKKDQRILFEGAQGVMLDLDNGTYPFVTSSYTTSGSALTGTGINHKMINFVLGITKAYTTRVGSGPFPTEFKDDEVDLQDLIGIKGKEIGTNTGRIRRCGWFDAVAVRQAIKVSGINGIALTKLDILDILDEIKICIGYELNNEKINYFPSSTSNQWQIRPIYEIMKGWNTNTQSITSWVDMPLEANKYIRRIEELIEVPVTLLSTSPCREDTICVHDPFLA